jgi:hypothetical protein
LADAEILLQMPKNHKTDRRHKRKQEKLQCPGLLKSSTGYMFLLPDTRFSTQKDIEFGQTSFATSYLPEVLEVANSSIPGGGLGLICTSTTHQIPADCLLGPFLGVEVHPEDVKAAQDKRYLVATPSGKVSVANQFLPHPDNFN